MLLYSYAMNVNHKHFTGVFIYPEWFNQKKYEFYICMKKRIEKAIWIHIQSARYFDTLHFRLFAPSITITALSGIASFLSSSEIISKTTQTSFAIAVGVMSSLSTMIQSVVSTMKYSAKADAHRLAADEYTQLLTRVKFEIEMPNERNFGEILEKKILDIQHKCKYFPPQHIVDSYKEPINDEKKEPLFKSSISPENLTKTTFIDTTLQTKIANETTHLLENNNPSQEQLKDAIVIHVNESGKVHSSI